MKPMVVLNAWIYSLCFLGAAAAYCMFWAVHWGISYRRHHRHPDWLDEHRSYVGWTSIFLTASVIDVVMGVAFVLPACRLSPFAHPLGKIHIACAFLFALLFILAKKNVTGLRHPGLHRFVVYPCIFLGATTLITGFILLAPLLKP